ncbi:MAG TPA: hypothetical protein VHV82_04590 [Sporichthyaceae bacterium]|nr:hypothetical protein [Sporichthyaceae bacterium]
MGRKRSYWVYSAGLAVTWAVLLVAVVATRGAHHARPVFYVFAGFAISWVSGTIARYTYPPPARWAGRNPPN